MQKKQLSHDKFSHPTIIEALCEIHFSLPEHEPWKPSVLGDFFKVVQQDFSIMEPVQPMGVTFEIGQHGVGQRLVQKQQQARYFNENKELMLQLSDSAFTVNCIGEYPGWEKMRTEIIDAWTQACKVLNPQNITRLGLRYINRLPQNSSNPTLGYWLTQNDYIPAATLSSQKGLLSRVQTQQSSEHKTIVTLADEPVSPDKHNTFIFDIDCIHIDKISLDNGDLGSHIDILHNQVWKIFASAMTTNLQNLLKTGEQE